MRPWYRHTEKDDYVVPRPMLITPFSKIWGFGAPVTLWLIGINTGIWLFMVITGYYTKLLPLDSFWYEYLAMTPKSIYAGWVWQIVTSMFLHDGQNILHILLNMYFLWMFGPRVERTFSSRSFLAFYLVCGIVGSILSLLLRTLMGQMDTASLGASAAVFGVLVGYAFLFWNEKVLLFLFIPLQVWKVVLGFIFLETLFIIMDLMQGVDHYAHLGGAIAAAVWMLVVMRKLGDKNSHGWFHRGGGAVRYRTHHSSPRHGFKVIITRPDYTDEHPEGTDSEPPPKWFDLD